MVVAPVHSNAEMSVCVSAYVGYSTVHSQARQATTIFLVKQHAPLITTTCF